MNSCKIEGDVMTSESISLMSSYNGKVKIEEKKRQKQRS